MNLRALQDGLERYWDGPQFYSVRMAVLKSDPVIISLIVTSPSIAGLVLFTCLPIRLFKLVRGDDAAVCARHLFNTAQNTHSLTPLAMTAALLQQNSGIAQAAGPLTKAVSAPAGLVSPRQSIPKPRPIPDYSQEDAL